MKKSTTWGTFMIIFVSTIFISASSTNAWKHGPYKRFVIKNYRGKDILCSTYIVRKGDRLWHILRLKGCLARDDFPRFFKILKRLNPQIHRLDRIYPGQRIIIPLKDLSGDRFFDNTKAKTITIPILPDIFYFQYEVSPGDTVVKILARQYGVPATKITHEDLENFKRVNPDMRDINAIYPHQRIRIPVPIPSKLYPVIASSPKADVADERTAQSVRSREDLKGDSSEVEPWSVPLVSRVISAAGGTLVKSGIYYFPFTTDQDRVLHLSKFPVIEWKDGSRFLISAGGHLSQETEKAIRLFWKSMSVIRIDRNSPPKDLLDAVFSNRKIVPDKARELLLDNGIKVRLGGDWILKEDVPRPKSLENKEGDQRKYTCITLIDRPEERTPPSICRYLSEQDIRVIDILVGEDVQDGEVHTIEDRINGPEIPVKSLYTSDQRAFVNQFLHEMGFSYAEDVPISFSYEGFEVNTFTNFLRTPDGTDMLVDFETLFGDAKTQIEASNLKVLTIRHDDGPLEIAKHILHAINIPYKEDPVFLVAKREVSRNISITIPCLLILYPPQSHTLLTNASFSRNLYHFLKEKRIRVLKMDEY